MRSIFKAMVVAALCSDTITLTFYSDDNGNKNTGLKFNTITVNVTPSASTNVAIGSGAQSSAIKSTDEKAATVKVDKNVMIITDVKKGKASAAVTDKSKRFGTVFVNVITPLALDKINLDIVIGKEDAINIKTGRTPYTVNAKDSKIATAIVKDAKITIKDVKAEITIVNVLDKNKLAGTIIVTVK